MVILLCKHTIVYDSETAKNEPYLKVQPVENYN